MNKERDFTFAGFMGAIFIVIGVIGLFAIVTSFDYETYNEIKDYSATYADEIVIMESELQSVWILGIASLIINVAIGTVLLTLGKIVRLLEDIRDQ